MDDKPRTVSGIRDRYHLLRFDISINICIVFGTWLIVYSLSGLKLVTLLTGIACLIAALILLAYLYFGGHRTELKRAAAFSILSAGIVFFFVSAAYLFENITYTDDIPGNPVALFNFTMTIILLPTALFIIYRLDPRPISLLSNLISSGALVLGVAGIVLSPYPIYLKVQDSNYDPDGIGGFFCLAVLSFIFIPIGIVIRWRILKKLNS